MSAALAMSGPPEDYSVQPCKKQRKDDDHSSKTITNYFSPVSKAVEKVLSSPRSSNIADYFIRCSPVVDKEYTPSQKITSPDRITCFDQSKAIQSPPTPLSRSNKAAGRLTKATKRTRLIKRLSDLSTKGGSDGDDGNDSPPTTEVCGNTGFMGSDTAALLAEICSEAASQENDEVRKAAKPAAKAPLKTRSLKRKIENECTVDLTKPAPEIQRPSLTSNKDLSESKSTGDSSLEENQNPSNILTISFEDYVKSQAESESVSGSSSQGAALDTSDTPNASSDPEQTQQPSPKTVTVQAQVHLSPTLLSSPTRPPSKIASIFKKKKAEEVEALVIPSTPGSDSVIPKRKSNVVIEEEDLELAVIDVDSMEPAKQKALAAERQQFMKAFRQVGDTPKSNPKKSVGKKKEIGEASEKPDNTDGEPQEKAACDEQTDNKTKGKAKKKAVKKKQSMDPEEPDKKSDTIGSELQSSDNKLKKVKKKANKNPEEPDIKKSDEIGTEPQSPEKTEPAQESPAPRRSLRRQKSVSSPKSPSKARADSPVLMSTPKVKTPCQKSNFYKSEMLTAPSDSESPIRMRFTRLTRRSGGQLSGTVSDDEAFTPGRKKVSKTINKAKQLLEKAKIIQQNIAKAETPQRRSARQQKRVSQTIIIDETSNSPISKPKAETKGNLRSLNDVLGKRKEKSQTTPGLKKEVKKRIPKSGIITIDDGSEASENSQDDEQFKARREFLKSGLPDSLKRHIAKTAAIREAYTLSCSSFGAVVHVQQRDGCAKWNLTMPLCPLLSRLSPDFLEVPDVSRLPLAIGDLSCCSKSLLLPQLPVLVSRRPVFSEAIRSCLLEEIRWYNPQFPVRRFFNQFLKKQSDYLAIQDNSKPVAQQMDKSLKPGGQVESAEPALETGPGTKRKRKDSPGQASKRRKAAEEKEEPADNKKEDAPTTRAGRRLSRASLRKSASSDPEVIVIEEEATAVPDTQSLPFEDVLWTEKYQPQNSSELIGNSAPIRRLHSWLREWKIRAEKEEKRNQKLEKEKDKNDTLDLSDFRDSEDSDEESLCNTVLITGPIGVGKTAAVYACAQELGFKVFEVNASCQRSGRQILAQLKEATQSHQVDQQGVNAHKPCFFSNYNIGKSPRKLNSPKKVVVSSPRKPPMSPRSLAGKKSGGLAPKSLANFFKAAPKQKTEEKKNIAGAAKATRTLSQEKTTTKTLKPPLTTSDKGSEETQRKTATSLILFEEVDVIFDDDTGFLSAIKTFMSTTKRPVIMTTSDPMFGMMFDGAFEEITFHIPSVVNVASYLQVLCLSENVRTDAKEFITFLTANNCDIRQSMLQLQFWLRSGGGAHREKALPPPTGTAAAEEDVGKSSKNSSELDLKCLPMCNFGSVENLMGLGNLASNEGLIKFVKSRISSMEGQDRIVQLLVEFQMQKKDFIFSNLESLLPLQVKESCASTPCESAEPPIPCKQECPAEEEDIKLSAQMRRRKKMALLNDSDLFDSDSRSLDEMLVVPPDNKPDVNECPALDKEPVKASSTVKRKLTEAEQRSSRLVYSCLDSMATLADNLSYTDCCTCEAADQADACNMNWTESRLLHGLCDSLRLETRDPSFSQSAGDIRGHIEGLALYKCSSDLTKVLDSSLDSCRQSEADPTEQLTLLVSKSQSEVHFRWPSAATSAEERRLSVVKSILSNRTFAHLGNRQANVTDYLPALRSICRIEKAKEEGKTKRRFLHYLEGIHLELPRATLDTLAADFP